MNAENLKATCYLFFRGEHEGTPTRLTVSRNPELPDGKFKVAEYKWGILSLWFLEQDNFTHDERQQIFDYILQDADKICNHFEGAKNKKNNT